MDQPFLAAVAGRSGETGDSKRDVGLRAVEGTFCHRPGDRLRYRFVMVQQPGVDPEEVDLGLLGVGDEAALEAVARALDVGEQRRQHAPGAAFGRGDRQLPVAQPAHQPLGLLVELVGKRRLERFAQPRSPLRGGGAAPRSPGVSSRSERNWLSSLQLGQSAELARP